MVVEERDLRPVAVVHTLGKALTGRIAPELASRAPPKLTHDSSTNALISGCRRTRGRA
jgi:hypothetical protein